MAEEWSKEHVIEFIKGCKEDEGYPMFQTFGEDVPIVRAICWGGRNEFKDSEVFINVPKEMISFLRSGYHDWQRLLTLWGEKDLLVELLGKGIYLPHAKRLPKIIVK